MRTTFVPARGLRVCVLSLLTAIAACAQAAAPDLEKRLADLEKATKSAQMAGDNAWMLTSSALVLMMTGPGLALFYGGLVRRKNVLSTMMHSFVLMGVVTMLWAVVGYSIAFAEGTPFFGDLRYLFLHGVGAAPNADYGPTIPQTTYMVYQLMFAIITPALISGAFAERMKFSAMLLFTTLWSPVVYFPMAHMVWGKGGLFNASLGGKIPAFDFAGGTVVHITSGVSALICALYLGKRVGYPDESMRPHNLVLSTVGACMLWVGWFGFNAGSAVNASALASSAFVATHFSRRGRARLDVRRMDPQLGKPSMLGGISGCVAGLVAITPASGFVQPFPAMLIGAAAGVVCFFMVTAVKKKFHYDDALDAFGVHGIGRHSRRHPHRRLRHQGDQRRLLRQAHGLDRRQPRPGAQPGHRRRRILGVGHRRNLGHPQGLRSAGRRARHPRRMKWKVSTQHARRRRIYVRIVERPVRAHSLKGGIP